MQRPRLVIMAAGLGSRYGGLKQIAPVDDLGHIIIDFSLFDARRAGFEDVTFIVKPELERDFRLTIGDRVSAHMRIEYARQALSLGATGQLSVTPYYNKATQTGLLRHYEAILDACPLPMILYNVPSRTGVCIKPETAVKLSRHSLIAGIKEASGDFTLIADLLVQPGMMPVYCGNDDLIWPMMAMGAVGAVSVVSNVAPQRTLAVTRAALAGHVSEAAAAQRDILPLIRALFAQVNPIPVKAALSMLGLCGDVLRLPLTPMEEPHREQLRALLSMQTFL